MIQELLAGSSERCLHPSYEGIIRVAHAALRGRRCGYRRAMGLIGGHGARWVQEVSLGSSFGSSLPL